MSANTCKESAGWIVISNFGIAIVERPDWLDITIGGVGSTRLDTTIDSVGSIVTKSVVLERKRLAGFKPVSLFFYLFGNRY